MIIYQRAIGDLEGENDKQERQEMVGVKFSKAREVWLNVLEHILITLTLGLATSIIHQPIRERVLHIFRVLYFHCSTSFSC